MVVSECLVSETGELSPKGNVAIKEALGELTQLKGVGPATATAVLCRYRPDLFCYMYDEVIDTFEPKRDYTLAVYLRINSQCLKIAKTLGNGWTSHRVATVLWTAARVASQGGDDLTANRSTIKAPSKTVDEGVQSRPKRRRTR